MFKIQKSDVQSFDLLYPDHDKYHVMYILNIESWILIKLTIFILN
jgi:hypothetical protein